MLRKLRHKFILVNMLLVGLVLLVVVGGLIWYNMDRLEGQSEIAMRLALDWKDDSDPIRFELDVPSIRSIHNDGNDKRRIAMIPVFAVIVDESGETLTYHSLDSVTVTDQLLNEAVAHVQASGKTEGVLWDLRLRYLVREAEDGTHMAFADLGWEQSALASMALSALPIGIVAFLCLFLVSFLLSTLALKPIIQAWEQQRQFVADASHELKTPLTVILANAGIVLSHPTETVASQQKWITFIQEEGTRMRSLVEDMLFLAKNDAARQPLCRSQVQLSELVTGCVLLFEPVAFEAGIHLESDIASGLVLRGDEGQLKRLVMILLDNGVKYGGAGGRVEIRLSRVQDKLVLSVHNTGDPIPPEHLPHIFERFYRADSARSRDRGGYGLGLAIAKAITKSHGGKITAESDSVRGTVFTVTFPLTSSRFHSLFKVRKERNKGT